MEPPIRVLVADGQPLFLDGLARAIHQDPRCTLVAAVGDGRAALDAIRTLRPDVALVELGIPGLDGRRVVCASARDAVPTAVVVLADGERSDAVYDAVADGARGCLSKRVGPDAVRSAVRRVARGEAVMCPRLQSAVAGEIQLRHRGERDLLSARQRHVLALIAQGCTTAEIAARLHVAPSTVKSACAELYERLGVRDRAEAVAAGMRRGFLD
jgi:two-component system nitrate/nitrite response regulator NarL